jgi:hypothetical protein
MRSTKGTTAVSASAMQTLTICLIVALAGCSLSRAGQIGNGLVIGSGVADVVSTRAAIARGGHEANPVMSQSVWQQVLVKSLGISAVIAGSQALEQSGRTTLAHVMRWSAIGVWSAAAVHNYRRARTR